MSTVTLVTGGARSGKSRYALTLAGRHERRAFIATALVTDDEMRERIRKHREERGPAFTTIEEPLDLASALGRLPDGCGIAIVDCITVWLGNLMHVRGADGLFPEVKAFVEALRRPPCDIVVVTNEVGMGVVPPTELGREFRDRAGRLNQEIAALADEVVFMVSGIPLVIKGGGAGR